MKTKKAAALLLIIIILCFIPSVFAMDFSDIPDDFWAYTEIEDLTSTGIINGYPDGTYKPHGTITKAEFLKLVLLTCFPEELSFGYEVKEGEHWIKYYFEYAKKFNLIDDNWTIDKIDVPIKRIEMCRLIAYANMKVTKASLGKEDKEPEFIDTKDIEQLDKNLLTYNVNKKFLYGYEDGTFKPAKNMTRAETACVIYRIKGEVEHLVDYSKISKTGGGGVTKYTITYDANGGEGAPQSEKKTKGKDYIISSVVPTKDGFDFLGWNTVKDTIDVMYVGGDKYTKNSNLKLYAVWQNDKEEPIEKTKYLIQFVDYDETLLQSGEVESGEMPVYDGEIPTRSGDAEYTYEFDKWTPDIVVATKDATYTATYTQTKNRYVIRFEDEDGTFILSGDYEYGTLASDIVLPQEPEKESTDDFRYKFKEWVPQIVDVVDNATYTASYDEIEIGYYTLSYDVNGSETDLSLIEGFEERVVREGTTITIPDYDEIETPVTMHTFAGWTSISGDAVEGDETEIVEYLPGDEFDISGDTILYAVFTSDLIYSKANAPVLGKGMKAVWWEDEDDPENSEVVADEYEEDTYSYNSLGHDARDEKTSKWANAITEDDGSYWVWIPRFAYKIHSYRTGKSARLPKNETTNHNENNAGQIEVIFLRGTSDDEYIDENGDVQELPEGYIVHPAFQKMTAEEENDELNMLGKWNEDVEGIWVAKFEMALEKLVDGEWTNIETTGENVGNVLTTNAGGEEGIRVVSKPTMYSWRNINVSNAYANLKNMHVELNSHEMKNSEWGAIAYLTYSTYGRNGYEIAVNQNFDYITGSGKGPKETGANPTVLGGMYNEPKDTINETDFVWYRKFGKYTSTTGNIYGIYDLSGGAYEYVSSYLNNGNNRLSNGTSLANEVDNWSRQVYESLAHEGDSNPIEDYALLNTNEIIGDAIWETSIQTTTMQVYYAWLGDESYFPVDNNLFFIRGGSAGIGSMAGLFSFNYHWGIPYSTISARPVIITSDNIYTIEFDANAGDDNVINMPSPLTKEEGIEVELPDNEPERDGCVFKGWALRKNAKEADYQSGDTFILNGNRKLYAVWENIPMTQFLKVGDYVLYIPTSAEWVLNETEDIETGYDYEENGINDTLVTDENAVWRVWNISGDIVEIIPNNALHVESIYLRSNAGYSNSKVLLDSISSTLYNSPLASSVRSMTYEDVEAKATMPEPNNNKFAYFLQGDETELPSSSSYSRTIATTEGFDPPRFYLWESDSDEELKYNRRQRKTDDYGVKYMIPMEGRPVYVKQSFVYGNPEWDTIEDTNAEDTTNYGDVFGNEFSWLASTSASIVDHFAAFGVRIISSDIIAHSPLIYSEKPSTNYDLYGLRPIVTLRTGLQVASGTGADEDNAWVIVDNN